jgi:hypothetical protein
VPLDQNRISVRILRHGLLQALCQILLVSGIFDNGNPERIEETQHALALAAGDTLDLLDVADLEAAARPLLPLDQESHKNRPLRMGMNAAARALLEGGQEEGCACGGLQAERFPDILSIGRGVFRGREFEDEEVMRLHQLFLHAGRGNEDVVVAPD